MSAQEQPPSNKDAAQLVLGRSLVTWTGFAMNAWPNYTEDIGTDYAFIRDGNTHWPDGKLITDMDKTNMAAGAMVCRIPELLTLPEDSGLPQFDAQNPWHQPVLQTLQSIGLYEGEGPTQFVQSYKPFFQALHEAVVQYDPRLLRRASAHMPTDEARRNAYVKYRSVADAMANESMMHVRVLDADEIASSLEAADVSTIAPATPEGGSWDLEDVTREVPVKTVEVSRLAYVEPGDSAEYLNTLLFTVEKLSTQLR